MIQHHARPRRRFSVLAVAFVLAVAAPIGLTSQDSGRQLASKEWTTVSGDLGNTRYSTLVQINPQTIGNCHKCIRI